MTTLAEMVSAVKKHALENYNTGGWDSIVECYDASDIERELTDAVYGPPCTTTAEAIARIGGGADLYEEQRIGAQAASGELEQYGLEERDGLIQRKEQ